jgi:hypothetical protein
MKSWKTTATGIITIVIAVGSAVKTLIDNDPSTNPDIGATIAAVTVGFGLIAARDNNVSSEDAGIK